MRRRVQNARTRLCWLSCACVCASQLIRLSERCRRGAAKALWGPRMLCKPGGRAPRGTSKLDLGVRHTAPAAVVSSTFSGTFSGGGPRASNHVRDSLTGSSRRSPRHPAPAPPGNCRRGRLVSLIRFDSGVFDEKRAALLPRACGALLQQRRPAIAAYPNRHGGRFGRESQRLAAGSPMKSSLTGSHLSGRLIQ